MSHIMKFKIVSSTCNSNVDIRSLSSAVPCQSIRSRLAGCASIALLAGSISLASANADREFERLSLQDVITRALENNYEIQIERINPEIQRERIMTAQSAFDLRLNASYNYESSRSPQNAQEYVSTGGGTGTSGGFGAGNLTGLSTAVLDEPSIFVALNQISKIALVKKFSLGTVAELSTVHSRLDNSLNRDSAAALFHPEYETYTGLTVTQPLLQGFGHDANLAEIRIARSNHKLADLEWRSRTSGLVGQSMKRYYDVVFAYENMEIQKDAIGLAEKLLEDNRKRSAEGVVPPNDVYLAEAAVFVRREKALIAESEYMERQNALQLLYKSVDDVGEVLSVLPTDSLSDEVDVPARSDLLDQAWRDRYDLLQAREVVNQRGHQTAYAKNQVKPRLDLIGSAGLSGLAANTRNSYGEANRRQGSEWVIGVTFSVPFSFERQKAQLRAARRQEDQARIDVQRVKTQVSLEIDTVLSRLRLDKQRVETARQSREVARKTLDGESMRLEEGLTTSYRVLEYQKEYSQTRSREVAALADLNKGIVDLWLMTSQVLSRRSIVVEGATNYSKDSI